MTIAKHLTPHDLKLEPPPGPDARAASGWNEAYDAENEAFKKANLHGQGPDAAGSTSAT